MRVIYKLALADIASTYIIIVIIIIIITPVPVAMLMLARH
jgi:hypothetical protein